MDVEASHPLQERRRHQELVQLVGRVPKERVNGHTQDNFAEGHESTEREKISEVVEPNPRARLLGVIPVALVVVPGIRRRALTHGRGPLSAVDTLRRIC